MYARLDQGLRFLNDLPLSEYPKFWVDENAIPETGIYPRAYMQHKNQVFPTIDDYLWISWYFCRFAPGDDVVVIGNPRTLSTRADYAFSSIHLRATKLASRIVARDGLQYEILAEHIVGRVDHKLAPASTMPDAFFRPTGTSVKEGQVKPPITFALPAQAWAYGAVFQLRDNALEGPFVVRISANVTDAPVAIGVLNVDGSSFSRSRYRPAVGTSGDCHAARSGRKGAGRGCL